MTQKARALAWSRLPSIPEAKMWTLVASISFLLVFPTDSSSTPDCPDDPQMAGQVCLRHYLAITSSNPNYFTGMDVENVRRICISLRSFARCLTKMDETCPGVDRDNQLLPEGLVSVWKMCTTPDENKFIDVYARTQYCYQKVSSMSNRCYADFITRQRESYALDNNPSLLRENCRSLGSLESCVSNTVFNSCNNEEAYRLVPRLVQASVSWSHKCLGWYESTTQLTTTEQGDASGNQQPGNHGNKQSYWYNKASHSCSSISWLLLLSTLVISKLWFSF